ncbi:ligase-associated DNA damage response endonuclease PdeM [Limoniibacter endophyticus]|uniref:Metallophosphatase n=1 Tax=Limoniibacter endophyticus TaxID=1565040 RepID=A0A8J3DGX8_9HYPH|nr:ligase-associated DNA damage response endonuclease PdeM [Limoniibacter endophyticus]GHC66524.1 metallophosphatase [Limoniibacter endophyticus]
MMLKPEIVLPAGARLVLLRDERVICLAQGALYLPESKTLIVSDLHLEKGSSLARRGWFLPPYDSRTTLALLAAIVAQIDPKRIVSLGDSFHDSHGAIRLDNECVALLAGMQRGRDFIWISGNHDPVHARSLGGDLVENIQIGDLVLRHEPGALGSKSEISGHLHPCARIVRNGRAVRRRCFATDGTRMILPAFGTLAGSLNVLDAAYAGLFATNRFQALMMGESAIFAIAHRMLVDDRPGLR